MISKISANIKLLAPLMGFLHEHNTKKIRIFSLTGLVRTSIFDGFATRERITIGIFENLFGKSVEQGAQTSIYLATEKLPKESINGKFFADCRPIGKQIDKFAPHDMLDSFWDYTNNQL